jgi:hypothetical protein
MNSASTVEILSQIQMEYAEMPDLKLTGAQARRLWNLSHESCDAALASLVRSGFLYQARDGSFLRCDRRVASAESHVVSLRQSW